MNALAKLTFSSATAIIKLSSITGFIGSHMDSCIVSSRTQHAKRGRQTKAGIDGHNDSEETTINYCVA